MKPPEKIDVIKANARWVVGNSMDYGKFKRTVWTEEGAREAYGRSAEEMNRIMVDVYEEMGVIEHPERPGWMAHPKDLKPNPEPNE